MQGRRETGGSWSRPDLALIGYRKYEFLPERVFELFSFEVKPANDVSIKGVMAHESPYFERLENA